MLTSVFFFLIFFWMVFKNLYELVLFSNNLFFKIEEKSNICKNIKEKKVVSKKLLLCFEIWLFYSKIQKFVVKMEKNRFNFLKKNDYRYLSKFTPCHNIFIKLTLLSSFFAHINIKF